jgi:hypothetical protein
MSKQFLKSGMVQLLNGGYLSNKAESPIYNEKFVIAQQHAEYIVIFAELAKKKDFVGKKADNLEDLRQEVIRVLGTNAKIFVEKPKSVSKPTHEKLASEALAFINFQDSSSKVDKINNFLQQFSVISEFEEFGLFFEEEICKLNKIYTMKDVIKAVTETIDLLDKQ